MCGFVGYLGSGARNEDRGLLTRMTSTIAHRGPDAAGYWCDPEQSIWMGHRRLSIVDLSAAGAQPMHSPSGRYVLIFNGEIYNHLELRKELTASGLAGAWRGHSDTETLLGAFEAWGIQRTLQRAVGMFSCAAWDRHSSTLTLARDRLGEKPLYYGWQGRGAQAVFLFGSELKALKGHPEFEDRIDRNALCLQLRHSYIPAPYSIYSGIAKLPPGQLLTVSLAQRTPCISSYWDANKVAASAVANPFDRSPKAAVDELEVLLKNSIGQQMVADVPLGAFLSGGVDSSLIVALMQVQSVRPVKTFTIGFVEDGYNEARHALQVARHLKTDHTELYVTGADALAVVPALPVLFDEPFSDSSQIPTFLLSRLARQHVTVSLSGDGGDELFCGYGRYQSANALWRRLSACPPFLQKLAGHILGATPGLLWDSLENAFRPTAWHGTSTSLGHKIGKARSALNAGSLYGMYRELLTHWNDPASIVLSGHEPDTLFMRGVDIGNLDTTQKLMLLDLLTYLPDDVLVKVDRAAMGASLETRAPFLDHRVVEFAWRLPQSMKIANGDTKWALRQVLYRHVPPALIERPKMGFGVPVGAWLRGPLRAWAEALLDRSRLQKEGYLSPEPVRQKWEEHLSGKRNWQYHLWDVLMFQSWLEHQQSSQASRSHESPAVYEHVA